MRTDVPHFATASLFSPWASPEKAAQWKEKFLAAFNWQAVEIARLRTLQATPEWTAIRFEGKEARREETDVIKTFVEYAKSQGSKSAGKYYLVISKETNRSRSSLNLLLAEGSGTV